MRIWHNLQNMQDLTYSLTRRGFQLTAVLLAIGCCAILKHDLFIAQQFQQLSSLVLLLTAITTPYIELRSK